MLAVRLHGPRDLRVERIPHPGSPGRGEVLLRVKVTGICGSDLHSYHDARIGDTKVKEPLVLGHEFAGIVEAVGPDSLDGRFEPIKPGTRVAVDPAQPCGHCELCERGHPNLCSHLRFCGNHPNGGSLCEWMHMPARSCFPLPKTINDIEGALLEPLGVAIHTVDLAKIRVADTVAVLGAGPVGLLTLQVARLAGAARVFITDKFPWRLKLAEKFGGTPVNFVAEDAVQFIMKETRGRGVDVAIEAAWGDQSVAQAAELARLGGRLVLVGIPADDRFVMKASTARRKGLTIRMCRRMKHVYPRAIELVERGMIDLNDLVSHRFPLKRAVEGFRLNSDYQDKVVKVVVQC
jgi:L-iditol 2-dehydrogenase